MKFAIRIPTYQRPYNLSVKIIKQCFQNILSQTHDDWKIFLVGDNYEDRDEFDRLVSIIPPNKITAVNLHSSERDHFEGFDLWRCQGVMACNVGLNLIRKEGIEICAVHDDDDHWDAQHLEILAEGYHRFPETVFVYTKGLHEMDGLLPKYATDLRYNNLPPIPNQTLHSSVSWNVHKIPLDYINPVGVPNTHINSDAELWERIRTYCQERGMRTLYIPKLTVWHHPGHDKKGQTRISVPVL